MERNPPIEWDLENTDFFLFFFFLEKFLGVTNKQEEWKEDEYYHREMHRQYCQWDAFAQSTNSY